MYFLMATTTSVSANYLKVAIVTRGSASCKRLFCYKQVFLALSSLKPPAGDAISSTDRRAFTHFIKYPNLNTDLSLLCSLAVIPVVQGHCNSAFELLVGLNPATLVARADKINEHLQSAYNGLRYQYAQQGLAPSDFDWHYDPKALTLPAIRLILRDDSMAEILKGLRDWQAASSLNHIMTVILSSFYRVP